MSQRMKFDNMQRQHLLEKHANLSWLGQNIFEVVVNIEFLFEMWQLCAAMMSWVERWVELAVY